VQKGNEIVTNYHWLRISFEVRKPKANQTSKSVLENKICTECYKKSICG